MNNANLYTQTAWGADGAPIKGTADSATSNSLTDASLTGANDYINGLYIEITGGTGKTNIPILITDFVAATDTLSVAAWANGTPDATSTYIIFEKKYSIPLVNVERFVTDFSTFNSNRTSTDHAIGEARQGYKKFTGKMSCELTAAGLDALLKYTNGKYTFTETLANITGTADSATSSTVTDSALTGADDYVNGRYFEITGGTGFGQSRRLITDFVASTDTLTVSPAFTTTPDNTTQYLITGENEHKHELADTTALINVMLKEGFSLEAEVEGTWFMAESCAINSMNIKLSQVDSLATVEFDFRARTVTEATHGGNYNPSPINLGYDGFQIVLSAGVLASEVAQEIRTFTLNFNKGVEHFHKGTSDRYAKYYTSADNYTIDGEFQINLSDSQRTAVKAAMDNNTTWSIKVICTSDQIVSGSTAFETDIELKEVKLANMTPADDNYISQETYKFMAGESTGAYSLLTITNTNSDATL